MKNFEEINRTFTVKKTKFLQRVLWLMIPLLTIFTTNAWGDPTLCTSTSDLVAGDVYYISPNGSYGSDKKVMAKSTGGNNYPLSTFGDSPVELTLGGSSGAWTFSYKDGSTTYYVNATNTTSSNYLKRVTTNNNYGKFSIAFGAGNQVIITCTGKSSHHIMRYNSGSSCISCYSSGQNNIYLYKKPSCSPLTMSEVTATAGNGRIDLSWAPVSNANSYTVTCKKKSDSSTTGISIGSISGTNPKTCSITGLTNGTEYTWSVMPVGTGSYCADNTPATGDATPNVYYTVTWKNNGSSYTTTSVASGQKPTFPDNPSSCDATSTTFYGWSTAEWSGKLDDISDKTVYTSASSMPPVSGAITYYAVFCKGGTGSLTITQSDFTGSSLTGSYSTQTVTVENYDFEINACIQNSMCQMRDNATLSYIAIPTLPGPITGLSTTTCANGSGSAYSGTLHFKHTKTRGNADTNDIGKITLSSVTSFDWDLSANTTYTSGYLLTSAGLRLKDLTITYGAAGSKYLTNCCTSYDITLSGSGSISGAGTFSADATSACEGATVTLSTDICSGYTVGAWDVYKTGASGTKITVTSNQFTMPAYGVTVALTTTAKVDHFKDAMHETSGYTGDGYAVSGCNQTVPSLSNTTPASECEGEHYQFVGWVDDAHVDSDGTLLSGYSIVSGGTTSWNATGTTYYAVWAKEL